MGTPPFVARMVDPPQRVPSGPNRDGLVSRGRGAMLARTMKSRGRRMWTTLAFVVVALVGGVLLLAAMKPAEFRVERRTAIRAPADAIHAYLADFHRWAAWSPWEHIDPTMQRTFSGAPSRSEEHTSELQSRQ